VKYLVLILIGLLFPQSIYPQLYKKAEGFAKISAGVGMMMPVTRAEYSAKKFQGAHLRINMFEMSYFAGESYLNNSNTEDSVYASINYNIGLNIPIPKPKIGKRIAGIKGILIQPIVGLHFGGGSILGVKTNHINLSPGFTFQIPYALVDVRLNTAYRWSKGDYTHNSLVEGICFTPSITFEFDGLDAIWDSKIVKTGKFTSSYRSSTSIGGGWSIVSTTGRTSDFYMSDVRPFFALKPYYEIGQIVGSQRLKAFGLSFAGRYGAMMFDAGFDFGGYELHEPGGNGFDGEISESVLHDTKGKANALDSYIKLGLDPLSLIQMTFFGTTQAEAKKGLTKNLRLYGGLGVGYMMAGKATFINPQKAASSLDNFFAANPDLERNVDTDPSMIESSMSLTVFFQVELASISVFWQMKGGKVGMRNSFGVAYIIPYNRVIKKYKEIDEHMKNE